MTKAGSPTNGASRTARRPYSRHGLNALKGRVALRGWSALDRRTRGAQELLAWRTQLVADLGGEQELTAAKLALADAAARTWLYVRVLDTWILEQRGIVNLRRRSVLPVVRERQQLVDSLARLLGQLSLERKAKLVPDLGQYVAETYGRRAASGAAAGPGREDPEGAKGLSAEERAEGRGEAGSGLSERV